MREIIKNENKNNKSLSKKKIIVTKKEGKIVIKSIPIKNQEKKEEEKPKKI